MSAIAARARRPFPLPPAVLVALLLTAAAAGWALAAHALWHTTVPALSLPHVDPAALGLTPHQLARGRALERFRAIDWALQQIAVLTVLGLYAWRGAVFMRESAAGRIGTGVLLALLAYALVWLAELPFGLAQLWEERRYGLAHAGYVSTVLTSFIGLGFRFVFVAFAVAIAMALATPLRRLWWAPAALVFCLLALAQAFAAPALVLDTHPAPPALRAAADRLAAADGLGHVPITVQRVSRLTTAPNAEAVGFGPTREVVLWDTLFTPGITHAERVAVIAHELGHVKRLHVLRLIGWFALFALPLAGLIALFTRRRGGMARPEAVPIAVLVFVAAQLAVLPLANAAQRRYEAEADWISLQSTRDPAAERGLFVALARASDADPSPPTLDYTWTQDHPSIAQRVAMVQAWERRASAVAWRP